jgi:hypothetical protein
VAWPALATAAGVVLGGASALVGEAQFNLLAWNHIAWKWTLVVAAGIVLVSAAATATTTQVRQARRLRRADGYELRAETAEQKLVDAVWEELEQLSTDLRLYSDGRASLFLCARDHFVLVGRFSANPPYNRATVRPYYPLDQGVIGAAWADGKAADPRLPDPGPANATSPNKGWLDHQLRKHSITEDVAAAFTMKSRSYAALRLDRPGHRLGVLVVESTRPADETAPSDRAGGLRGGTIEALTALADAGATRRLARALEDLSALDEDDLRRHLEQVLADH